MLFIIDIKNESDSNDLLTRRKRKEQIKKDEIKEIGEEQVENSLKIEEVKEEKEDKEDKEKEEIKINEEDSDIISIHEKENIIDVNDKEKNELLSISFEKLLNISNEYGIDTIIDCLINLINSNNEPNIKLGVGINKNIIEILKKLNTETLNLYLIKLLAYNSRNNLQVLSNFKVSSDKNFLNYLKQRKEGKNPIEELDAEDNKRIEVSDIFKEKKEVKKEVKAEKENDNKPKDSSSSSSSDSEKEKPKEKPKEKAKAKAKEKTKEKKKKKADSDSDSDSDSDESKKRDDSDESKEGKKVEKKKI